MNTREYLTKIYANLQDHNTYKPLTHHPASAIALDIRTLIHLYAFLTHKRHGHKSISVDSQEYPHSSPL